MAIKLISFRLCPFVKKVEIVLNYKGIKYEIEYIDLAKPPEWFIHISPLKKVPLLLVDKHIIFESSAICEYIDEATPDKLHPDDSILRAQNRGWIEFGNDCLWDSFYLTIKETKDEFDIVRKKLLIKFDQIENALSGSCYFNGTQCSLVDLSFAPLLKYLTFIHEVKPVIFSTERHPKLFQWKNCLLELTVVQNTYSDNLKKLHLEQIWKRKGYLSQFLDKNKFNPDIQKTLIN